tara:strand:- start:1164 stop:1361 length:198 start_codon:yes stop_codon:yes gene_type:complete
MVRKMHATVLFHIALTNTSSGEYHQKLLAFIQERIEALISEARQRSPMMPSMESNLKKYKPTFNK